MAACRGGGIAFPADNRGDRSTTTTAKNILTACISNIDGELAQRLQAEKDWRHHYPQYFMQIATACLRSPDAAISIARSGLEAVHNTFEFVRGSATMSLALAMKTYTTRVLRTAVIKGGMAKELQVPEVPSEGQTLEDVELIKQLQAWADYGCIEPDVVEAVKYVQKHPECNDLSGRHFLVFGANSEMGPLPHLLQRGAHVIAIATRKSERWKRLIALARQSSGSLTFPVDITVNEYTSDDALASAAGCDLLKDAPEIQTWLKSVVQAPLTIGNYIYMDSEAHVRATVAVDMISTSLIEQLGKDNVSLAYLGSPAVACPVPEAAHNATKDHHQASAWWHVPLSWVCGFEPNNQPTVESKDGNTFYLNDGFAVVQGPNYALAKTIQMWRAMVARADGMVVSTPMAPGAKTESVMHNPQVATALAGMHHFTPLRVFEPSTASALMALLLIHDLTNPQAVSQPSVPLRNPMELFMANAVHGGGWRCGYQVDSIGTGLYICGKLAPEPGGDHFCG